MNQKPPQLLDLANHLGVATGYADQSGHWVEVDATVVREVLAALGFPARDEAEAESSLRHLELTRWRQVVPAVIVVRRGRVARVPLHFPHGSAFDVQLTLEDRTAGIAPHQVDHQVAPVKVDGILLGEAMIETSPTMPIGWHVLQVETSAGLHRCDLVVAPVRLSDPRRRGRGWGFAAQLYSVRSNDSWGLGDLADLAELTRWSGSLGADHLVVNPMHAAEPITPRSDSPYLPTSRRFADPMYLRPDRIPEYAALSDIERERVEQLHDVARAAGAGELLDRNSSWTAKVAALRILFAVPRTEDRHRSFAEFVKAGGFWLRDFATWCAISVDRTTESDPWPESIADATAPGVPAIRSELAEQIEFHMWLQWLIDQQSASTQRAAIDAGMSIGVIRDLAVGVHPGGADAWCWPGLLLPQVSVGAPPDMYNQIGQDWSQPPWHPQRLAQLSYRPFAEMVRAALRHSGGLRVDHVLGLFRLWWIPRGRPAGQGTFVRYDSDALLGILTLEAERAGAVIVGEDLGTVEPNVAESLADFGLLGTTVLWFERWGAGRINPPEQWRRASLASVTVHDLPPTLGYLGAEHVRLRDRLGVLERPVAQEFAAAADERRDWLEFARSRGLLQQDQPTDIEFMIALYELLGRSAAELVVISLADATGETRAQNQPGTHLQYPNWRIPLADQRGVAVLVEELPHLQLPRLLIAALTGVPVTP